MTTKTSKLTPRATIGHKSEHPTLLNHILVLAALICLVSAQTTTTTGTCKISQTTPKKASPSLVQCYRNNANSCCNSITDDYIKSQYTGLFSGSCARNFAELEIYFCFACSKNQPEFYSVEGNTKKIKVCPSFVKKIWGNVEISGPTSHFDQCGMDFNGLTGVNTIDKRYELPSKRYANAQAFLDDFKPPFFTDAIIEITPTDDSCYNSAKIVSVGLYLVFALFLGAIGWM